MNIPPGSRSKVFLVPWGGAFTTPPRPLLLHHRRPLGSLYQWSDTACALVWLLMQPAALTRAVICAPACSDTVCSHCSHLYEPPRFVCLHSGARGPRFRLLPATYGTAWHVAFDVSAVCQVESLVARYGLLGFGGCCQLSSSGCSSICFCLFAFFYSWQGRNFKAHHSNARPQSD